MSLAPARNLIDELLADQQSLTAVERFSQAHRDTTTPVLESHYRSLIPLSKPGPGEQYSFEVDLDACSGCKACVTACHSLNGLDDGESWRDVGTLVTPAVPEAVQQTVTSACHHCSDPACANGCPTLAYEKDADTGIVSHLDDQCIGCQYCTMTCPYEVPKYNDRLGIVRKCDMCQSRLKEGEAPACVQACPSEAIRIRIVPVEVIHNRAVNGNTLVPGAAPSAITKPSTTFLNLRGSAGSATMAADESNLAPAHAHLPLVIMLVLTQVAAGVLLFDVVARLMSGETAGPGKWHAILGACLAIAGLIAATLHLGRPLQAWKSFLGWRKSWLSREILVFGAWSGAAFAYVATLWLELPKFIENGVALGAAASGLAGVYCSVMVYVFTKRPFWSLPQTGTRFGLTLLAAGSCFTFPVLSLIALAVKLGFEFYLRDEARSPFLHSAKVINGPLRRLWTGRLISGLTALALIAGSIAIPALAFPGFIILVAGECLARALYFQAVKEPKMPGNITGS
ncbi:MAG: dimethyl sulfoxide reductase anchor subunit [Verrucomicrobiales bacterium]|nr:dimethyl sulfoxide reductase anchor subunit [Verrucomicrobiales bacterium]